MSEPLAAATTKVAKLAEEYLAVLSRYEYPGEGAVDAAALARSPEANRLFGALSGQPAELGDALVEALSAGLDALPDPFAAALVAIQVGSVIEAGATPVPLAEALLRRLPIDLAAARRFVALFDAETDVKNPDDADAATVARLGRKEKKGASAWASLRYSTPAAMAAWCRHRPSRQAAMAIPGFAADAAFLGSRGGYCHYIGDLLAAADGMQLTVIAPEVKKGFVVELIAVRNGAHLFALLEDTLVGASRDGLLTGPRTDPKVAAIARGEAELTEAMTFRVGWHYEYWWGLSPEAASKVSGLHPVVAAMIGVEASLHDVPAFRGQPLILMRPALVAQRTCDVGFFAPLHDALRSGVTVLRRLPQAEVTALCDDLRREAAMIRPPTDQSSG